MLEYHDTPTDRMWLEDSRQVVAMSKSHFLFIKCLIKMKHVVILHDVRMHQRKRLRSCALESCGSIAQKGVG